MVSMQHEIHADAMLLRAMNANATDVELARRSKLNELMMISPVLNDAEAESDISFLGYLLVI